MFLVDIYLRIFFHFFIVEFDQYVIVITVEITH